MERKISNFFGLIGQKESPKTSTVTAFEETRDGNPKAYIPNFFYKPPFGYPRYKDLSYYRQLAASIYVDMCETAIIDEVCSIEWDIVAEDRNGNEIPGKEADVERIKDFFYNPNTNKESWETIVRMMLPDLLELNSGIMVKTFNSFGEMVEIVSRDGMAFTKNPDIYGMYTNRADLILMKDIMEDTQASANTGYPLLTGQITEEQAREEGAYFQYGFNTGAKPVPFGKREIVWFEKKVRTDDLYGRSSMEVLAKTVQTLIYSVEHNLEYFSDNSIPPGVLGLEGMNTEDMKAFAMQWTQSQKVQDTLGNWKKKFHKLAMVNKMPKFERLGFTNQELELIESQKWWSKLVWACFGITATELGFTEDAKGSANQIVQSSIARKRIIYPLLRLIEYHVNTEIIPEFGVEGIRYKYKIFDVDEETKKWSLYKLQKESDLKTVNEIRATEGLDEIEGGDETGFMRQERNTQEDRAMITGEPLQEESDKINRDSQDTRDRMTGKNIDLKFKYVKRTGSPGNYIYWYKNPKTGKIERGDKPKESTEKRPVDLIENNVPEWDESLNEILYILPEKDFRGLKVSKLISRKGAGGVAIGKDQIELKNDYPSLVLHEIGHTVQAKHNKTSAWWGDLPGKKIGVMASEEYHQIIDATNKRYEQIRGNSIFTESHKDAELEWDYALKGGVPNKKNGETLNKEHKTYLEFFATAYQNYYQNPEHMKKFFPEAFNYFDNRKFESNGVNQKDSVSTETKIIDYFDWDIGGTETKALTTDSPLTLGPNEELDEDDLKKAIITLLRENKEKIFEVLEEQGKPEQLLQIKSVDDIPDIIKKIFQLFTFKKIVDDVISIKFNFGWEKSEKQIDQNVPMNNKAVEFLQNHTFDNIKDMTEEIANDLKAELSRGIVNGEGIYKLKQRVNKVFDVGENRAEMIARTETNRAENNGQLLAMKGSGIKLMKKWKTHEDARTSEICKRLDGQIVKLDEEFKDNKSGWTGQSPPSHVNCRSRLLFIGEEELEKKEIEELEKQITKKKLKEQKLIDENISLTLQEKEADIKFRKELLLKKLESDADGRN